MDDPYRKPKRKRTRYTTIPVWWRRAYNVHMIATVGLMVFTSLWLLLAFSLISRVEPAPLLAALPLVMMSFIIMAGTLYGHTIMIHVVHTRRQTALHDDHLSIGARLHDSEHTPNVYASNDADERHLRA